MSSPRTVEQQLLAPATAVLRRVVAAAGTPEAQLDVLEAAAAEVAGWSLTDYRSHFPAEHRLSLGEARARAADLLDALLPWPVNRALALAALGRLELSDDARRRHGAYYTDFRLAAHLVAGVSSRTRAALIGGTGRAIDPASGSGMLLVALTLALAGENTGARTRMIRDVLCAADLSADALRATRLAVAALTPDLDAVARLDGRLLVGDSLLRASADWQRIAQDGFALSLANPPWEKLKVTRHELLKSVGIRQHYGSTYDDGQRAELERALVQHREQMVAYLDAIDAQAELQGTGEADLYKLFLELGCRLLRPEGEIAMLLPAGVIRSQGTQDLRRLLTTQSEALHIDVIDNRARFFAIDTRFKFLALHATFGRSTGTELTLRHAVGGPATVRAGDAVRIDRGRLEELRPDLTVPEVRTAQEWELFERLHQCGRRFGDPDGPWRPRLTREVDMTRDQPDFVSAPRGDVLPLIEGRMVHQFRTEAKAHISGTGRAAVWEPLDLGDARTQPQFYFPRARLRRSVNDLVATARAGFCDVTGQTNERTLLAAVVPAGTVCGNKVPTVAFNGAEPAVADHLAHLWTALINSVPMDWLARRVVTTSVNYFLLLALPLPDFDVHGPLAARIASLARDVAALERQGAEGAWVTAAQLRAEIDVCVAEAWRLSPADLALMLTDFPLLDRGQPPLVGEDRSTVTRDLLLSHAQRLPGEVASGDWCNRANSAQAGGAVAYVPADYAALVTRTRVRALAG